MLRLSHEALDDFPVASEVTYGTITLPIGHSASPTSFTCAQANGMPMMVIASMTAVIVGKRQPPTGKEQPQDTVKDAKWSSYQPQLGRGVNPLLKGFASERSSGHQVTDHAPPLSSGIPTPNEIFGSAPASRKIQAGLKALIVIPD